MRDEELIYRIALRDLIGDRAARVLIDTQGSAKAVLTDGEEVTQLLALGHIQGQHLTVREALHKAEEELNYAYHNGIKILSYTDADYPQLLYQCEDAPVVLYQRGSINLEGKRLISVVGTRKASAEGLRFCQRLIAAVAPFDPVIVSGFAYGVDIVAHRAAMAHGLQTIACLGHGFQRIYPQEHSVYCAAMEANGGFFTDYGHLSPFKPTNFLARNRIVAGLSEATVVIESGQRGGSLSTAGLAFEYNREVFAVPGRPIDVNSVGCNELIYRHKAEILLRPEQLAEDLGWC
jgi:DNA protecting protein dprA